MLHWARFLMAVLLLIVAATHLSYIGAGGFGSAPPHVSNSSSSSTRSGSFGGGLNELQLWFEIEVIAYTIMAVVYLLGLRTWYLPAVLFNAFNVALYFLSGIVPIPGITTMAFGSRLTAFSGPISATVILMICWVAALVLGLALLKYDPGSELDKLLVTKKARS